MRRNFALTVYCGMRNLRGMNGLRHQRTSRGLLLKDAAESLGTDPGNLSRIESGKQAPSLRLARKIATFYGITLEQVFDGQSEKAA
ncbi:helix-turn-helix transcriptional regulator [Endozoicomonas sp. 4G]|uniref:helix-turn-helix domain-containing protein n=1 Tax=Endozoicomonas sp. 4G TaxID=2872754 RepID=UPI002078D24E|nr:helix-turn-helix transcriptional regulator [Endozoicomonas sp. 4G]